MRGIDISAWNNVKDYAAAKADGVQFAIIKVLDKNNEPDKRFEEHMSGCKKAGIHVPGGYNYSYATTVEKARKDAKAWLETAQGRIKKCWLDWEDNSLPKGKEAVKIIRAYAKVIKSEDVGFGVYCGLSWYNSYLRRYADGLPYPFWIARYPSEKSMSLKTIPDNTMTPGIDNKLYAWQYSQNGHVNGIEGAVDLNIRF